MTFARTTWAEEKSVLAFADEATGSQIEDNAPVHLRIEGEVEAVERSLRVAKAGLLAPAFQQAV
jgi:hypothetical protein